MIRALIAWIYEVYRGQQQQEWKRFDDEETEFLRREHQERLRGLPPHLRSTRFRRRPRPKSDSYLLLKSILLVGVPFFIMVVVFCACMVGARLGR